MLLKNNNQIYNNYVRSYEKRGITFQLTLIYNYPILSPRFCAQKTTNQTKTNKKKHGHKDQNKTKMKIMRHPFEKTYTHSHKMFKKKKYTKFVSFLLENCRNIDKQLGHNYYANCTELCTRQKTAGQLLSKTTIRNLGEWTNPAMKSPS